MTLVTKEVIFEALDELIEHMPPHLLVEEILRALNCDQASAVIAHIVQHHDLSFVGSAVTEIVRSQESSNSF